jgi:hypothetical protein
MREGVMEIVFTIVTIISITFFLTLSEGNKRRVR